MFSTTKPLTTTKTTTIALPTISFDVPPESFVDDSSSHIVSKKPSSTRLSSSHLVEKFKKSQKTGGGAAETHPTPESNRNSEKTIKRKSSTAGETRIPIRTTTTTAQSKTRKTFETKEVDLIETTKDVDLIETTTRSNRDEIFYHDPSGNQNLKGSFVEKHFLTSTTSTKLIRTSNPTTVTPQYTVAPDFWDWDWDPDKSNPVDEALPTTETITPTQTKTVTRSTTIPLTTSTTTNTYTTFTTTTSTTDITSTISTRSTTILTTIITPTNTTTTSFFNFTSTTTTTEILPESTTTNFSKKSKTSIISTTDSETENPKKGPSHPNGNFESSKKSKKNQNSAENSKSTNENRNIHEKNSKTRHKTFQNRKKTSRNCRKEHKFHRHCHSKKISEKIHPEKGRKGDSHSKKLSSENHNLAAQTVPVIIRPALTSSESSQKIQKENSKSSQHSVISKSSAAAFSKISIFIFLLTFINN